MPKPKKGARLGGSASLQRKILSNLAAQLIEHRAITTTDAKAKMLRPYVEKLITKAKSGTVADRRNVYKLIPNKDVIYTLFHEVAPLFENRAGGYTRIIKVENRAGDNAPMSRISLVTEETVTAEATRATRVAASREAAKAVDEEPAAPVEETPAEETAEAEAPVEDAPAADADAAEQSAEESKES